MSDIQFQSNLDPLVLAEALAGIIREDKEGNVLPPVQGVPFISEVDPSWYELSRGNDHKLYLRPQPGVFIFSARYGKPALMARAKAVLVHLGCTIQREPSQAMVEARERVTDQFYVPTGRIVEICK